MDNNLKTSKSLKNKNFESFDLWGKAQFATWSNIRYDFELIAELTRYKMSTRRCLEILDTVNHHLKNPPERVLFDGTIKCLKYLIKNGYLSPTDLPRLTQDEKYLVELLEKYSTRLDITDVISDIEEPTLRAMFLEYPNLIGVVLKENPLAGNFVAKAMLKNGITDVDSLTDKVNDGLDSIEVDPDKNSKEAMKCKLIYLGLFLNNGKIKITRDANVLINELETLTDEVIENETYIKSVFNAMYAGLYGSSEWNEERRTHLSGCDTLYLDFQLLFLPDNHMSMTYDIFLSKEVDGIGKKYFGDDYDPNGFIGSLAIKMAVVIILFRTQSFIPEGEKEDVSIYGRGAMLSGLDYAIEETDDTENPLRLKNWFIDYFRNELDKRVAFIKMQVENQIAIVEMGMTRVVYLPVLESFRFFCDRTGLLGQIIKLFKNKSVPTAIKEEIFTNFAINIQKIVAQQKVPEGEAKLKDTFILLISQSFEGLVVKIAKKISSESKKYYDSKDFISDASVAVIELILNFDLSKSDSFIGYLTSNLYLKMKTSGRMNETEKRTFSNSDFEEGFLDSIPDTEDFTEALNDQRNLDKIREAIEKLPEKERLAVKKLSEENEKFTDTERKAKNRGLDKIREMVNPT